MTKRAQPEESPWLRRHVTTQDLIDDLTEILNEIIEADSQEETKHIDGDALEPAMRGVRKLSHRLTASKEV